MHATSSGHREYLCITSSTSSPTGSQATWDVALLAMAILNSYHLGCFGEYDREEGSGLDEGVWWERGPRWTHDQRALIDPGKS